MNPFVRPVLATTADVLEQIVWAIRGTQPDPPATEPPMVVHIAHVTVNEAPARKLFGRKE